jgi:phage antirepressor YoqD-like protein
MDYIRSYNGNDIRIKYQDDKVVFNLLDAAYAAGFSRASSLRYHTKGKRRETVIDGVIYLTVKSLNKVAKDASKTPGLIPFVAWAKKVAETIVEESNKPKEYHDLSYVPDWAKKNTGTVAPTKVKPANKIATTTLVFPYIIGVKEAAGQLGMPVQQLSNWLVSEGYASRYKGNNALYWNSWFKENGYGTRPVIIDDNGQRESNVAKLTAKGLEFVKSRLNSQRESGVLSFATKEANERDRLEKEVDALILQKFEGKRLISAYGAYLNPGKVEYQISQEQLLKLVKQVVAEVKLKEKA